MKERLLFVILVVTAFAGNVVNAQSLTVAPTPIGFGSNNVMNVNFVNSYTLSGATLTGFPGNITVTAPAGYNVSLTSNSGFLSSISVPYSSATLAATTIYVMFAPTSATTFSGNITHAGGGASTVNVAVSGGVTSVQNWIRSTAAGAWSTLSWEATTDAGATWLPTTAPTGSENIVIQTGFAVTVDAPLAISGYLKNQGSVTVSGGSLTFNGGTYEHVVNSGNIPVATWNTGSTCLITGTTSTNPGPPASGTTYYNYTWNCPGQSASLNIGWDNVTVNGDLTVPATGPSGGAIFLRLTNAATLRTITVNGNVIVNGGNLTVSGSSGAAQYNMTVKGNLTVSSNSKLQLCAGSGGFGTWYVGGNVSFSGTSQFVLPSNKTVGTILFFSKSGGAQSFTYTSSTTNGNLNYGVMNNTAVTLNSPITVGDGTNNGFLVLTSGKFITTATNVITLSKTGAVNTGAGFVDGPLVATVAAATAKTLTFPIGKGSVARQVVLTLTDDAATSTTFTAELMNTTPPVNALPATLDAVASARYIHIVKGTGATPGGIMINVNYDNTDGVDLSNAANIRIAKDDGAGNWLSLGGSGSANTTGNITSGNAFGQGTLNGLLTTNDFIMAHANPAFVPSVPTLTTTAITSISNTSAASGGTISYDGDAAITAKGVCWSTVTGPTTSDSKTSDGPLSTAYISSLTVLNPATQYYVRAYATNSAGTAYGNELSFTTIAGLSAPTVVTNAVTNIVNTSATGNGNVTDWGGSAITDRGICWGTGHNPTTANDFNSVGAGTTGAFTVPIGGLTLGTTYYVRAYAVNSTGTSYGTEVSFATPAAQPDVNKVVDINGTVGVNCDYTSVYDAFVAVPTGYTGHWFIYVKSGTYYDKVTLATGKINVVLVGQDKNNTIITYDDYAGNNRTTHGVLSNGTNTSYTCAIDASDFQAQNITFQNTANAYAPGSSAAQAVALRTNGDRQSYYSCRMLGYQDTYYTQGGSSSGPDRIYNKDCYVEGSVDFIFGRDVTVFDTCTIYCNRKGGVLTAASTEAGYTYGYVFLNCVLGSPAAGVTGADNTPMTTFYLGRPWQASPKTVYLNCYEPATVDAAGWTLMGPNPSLYTEYNCSGPGVASRAIIGAWVGANQPTTISSGDAATYTIANIFAKTNAGSGFSYAANWIPSKIAIDVSILPVEMSSFTATSNRLTATLQWNTATESNNYGFDVERANKTGEWQKVAFVAGAGTSNVKHQYSYVDLNLTATTYSYRLKQIDRDGAFKYSSEVEVQVGSAPKVFTLSNNYPNPFNPTTNIEFTVRQNGRATLKVYNLVGQEVAELFNGDVVAGRIYQAQFDASRFASGSYFSVLRSDDQQLVRKMSFAK